MLMIDKFMRSFKLEVVAFESVENVTYCYECVEIE